jgi:hypothetical protein
MLKVDRKHAPTQQEFIAEYSDRNRPVIISGAFDHWPAMDLFDLDYFEHNFGDRVVEWPGQSPLQVGPLIRQIRQSSEEAPAPYLQEVSIYEHFPEILDAVTPLPPYPFPDWASSPLIPRRMQFSMRDFELLIGGPGSKFRTLHQDAMHVHAFVFQIVGKKSFYLFPPETSPCLYPDEQAPNVSPIDPFSAPDLDRYPLYEQAQGVEVTVNPGEMVFVPSNWWHITKLEEVSIAVTINWVHRSNWDGYCDSMNRSSSGLKQAVKRNYFRQVGNVMNALGRTGVDRMLDSDRSLRGARS